MYSSTWLEDLKCSCIVYIMDECGCASVKPYEYKLDLGPPHASLLVFKGYPLGLP